MMRSLMLASSSPTRSPSSSPLSSSNLTNMVVSSPAPGKNRKSLTFNGAKAESLEHHELFHFHTVAFIYLKKEKQWKELGDGATKFLFEKHTSSIVIRRGDNLHHRVSVSTKVQQQVAQSQSWVFRAVHCTSGSHDVLCLQLPEDPSTFVASYESHRAKCMQIVEAIKNNPIVTLARASSSSTVSTASSDTAAGSENGLQESATVNVGADLSNGLRSIALKSTIPPSLLQNGISTVHADATSVMRRRLSTVGEDYTIDGYAPGARNEERMVKSPTQKSPLRPAQTGSAKTLRPAHAPPSTVSFSGISVKGIAPYNPDKQNQDALVLHQLATGEVILSVFDGHGEEGKTVSNHFQKRIPKYLATCAQFGQPETTGEALREALDQVEKEIVDDVHVDTTLSGSTGVVTVIRGQKLYVANVGDSRAIFGVQDLSSTSKVFTARDITLDHKPDHPEEKKRIMEVGGRVFAVRFDDGIDGPARVWLSYADLPGLAMSRSLGDTIAKEAGVTSKADLFEMDLTAEHKFMVIATDGLWEFMTSQEVVDIVAKYANSSAPDPEAAIEELIEESARRWRMNEPVIDDTSIIVAFFM